VVLVAQEWATQWLRLLSTEMHQVCTNVTTIAISRTLAGEKRSALRAQKR
jgi:hypothetical protein